MFDYVSCPKIYLACGITDGRKSFNGLSAIIKLQFNLDPYSCCMFVFCNKKRKLLKIMQWDGSGFWLFIKRLDRGNFKWPDSKEDVKQISARELSWLIEGLTIDQKEAFQEHYPKIII